MRASLTDDDGVVGELLGAAAVVVEGQVPDARFQVLDETGLVHIDRAGVSGSAPTGRILVPAGQRSLVFGDEAAAVQQLHKVVLDEPKTRKGVRTQRSGRS